MRDRRDQAGRDQRLAQILDPLGAIGLALAEAGDGLDMVGAEQAAGPRRGYGRSAARRPARPAGPGSRCGSHDRPRRRPRRPRRRRSRAGRARPAAPPPPRSTRAASTGSRAATANDSRSAAASAPAAASRPGQPDLGEAVERPRLRRSASPRKPPAGAGVDRGGDQRVIIAVGAQQLAEQLGVGARAAVDLGGVGRIAAIFLERRERRGTGRAAAAASASSSPSIR